MKLSLELKRTLYFESILERDKWFLRLEKFNNPNGTSLHMNYTSTGVELGRGSFGKIVKYQCNRTGTMVAVKIFDRDRSFDLDDQLNEYYI